MTASSTRTCLLGIDIGGTSIKAVLVDERGRRLGQWRRPTPQGDGDGRRTVEVVAELAGLASEMAEVAAVGVAGPGFVDESSGVCLDAVNLGWRNLPLRDLLTRRLGLPLAFGHDVRTGALAEARTGAAADARGICVFLPIGTGIAAAYTQGGRIVEFGPHGGEVGQIVVQRGPCAGLRTEEVASAAGIARRIGQPDARAAATLVRSGDPAARAAWDEAVDVLADIVAWTCAVLSPQVVVLGGGLSAAGGLLFDPLRERAAERVGSLALPPIRAAFHGVGAAMIGAVMLAGDLVGIDPYHAGRGAEVR
jgi:glucokinase